jgi:hypothetical protein
MEYEKGSMLMLNTKDTYCLKGPAEGHGYMKMRYKKSNGGNDE